MNWLDEIIDWHKKTFPKVTEQSQFLKIGEELDEYEKETPFSNSWYEERADVFITTLCYYARFNKDDLYIKTILSKFCPRTEKAITAVFNKFEKLKEREWFFNDEECVYKHK